MDKNKPRHLAQNGADTESKFLSFWFSDATGEIALRANYAEISRSATEVVPLGAFRRIESFIARHQAAHAAIYFCPATCPAYGRLGGLAAMPGLYVVLNVSGKYAEQVQGLEEIALWPTASYAVGSQAYLYWLLEEPLDLTSQQWRREAERLLAALCRELEGDLAFAKPGQFLPLPGPLNYACDPPHSIGLKTFEAPRRYAVKAFEDRLASLHSSRPDQSAARVRSGREPAAEEEHDPALTGIKPNVPIVASEAPEHRVQVRAAIATLAELSKLEFELQRKEAAKAVGLRVSAIDQLVNDVRSQFEAPVEAEPLWPEAVEGATLLDEIVSTIRKYVILGIPESHAVALWILFTHCFSAASFSPRLRRHLAREALRENHATEDSSSRMPACSALVQC